MVVTVYDLCHEIECLMLWESFFSGDKFGQVPLIAELGDNVGIVFGGVNVIDFNDIFGVFEVFEDLHF
jgi:hypothetical protein